MDRYVFGVILRQLIQIGARSVVAEGERRWDIFDSQMPGDAPGHFRGSLHNVPMPSEGKVLKRLQVIPDEGLPIDDNGEKVDR
jgi:hypothetical protein